MTKQEIRNILNKGWADRREKQKERDAKNSQRTADWTARQSSEDKNVRRWKHYLADKIKKKKD